MKDKSKQPLSTTQPWMVTLPKASRITGIPTSRLRVLIKSGELKSYRAGDRYYVWVDDLKEVLRGRIAG